MRTIADEDWTRVERRNFSVFSSFFLKRSHFLALSQTRIKMSSLSFAFSISQAQTLSHSFLTLCLPFFLTQFLFFPLFLIESLSLRNSFSLISYTLSQTFSFSHSICHHFLVLSLSVFLRYELFLSHLSLSLSETFSHSLSLSNTLTNSFSLISYTPTQTFSLSH